MTEQEWDNRDVPGPLLAFVRRRASARKLRLFACACGYRLWHLFEDKRSRKAVSGAERYADGLVSDRELRAVCDAANAAYQRRWRPADMHVSDREEPSPAAFVAVCIASAEPFGYLSQIPGSTFLDYVVAARLAGDPELNHQAEWRALTDLLRDIVGNPFRTATADPAWLSWNAGTVVSLASSIYEDRRFEELPVLGDALEEAGCTEEAILSHCHGIAEHVRGCWVLDLILRRK
ncbi:MAG TPA: hypothetical protein VEL76_38925 [Gemmataceae bacterium]|nr:hypothetical protein [Gemmataceae bacterium]